MKFREPPVSRFLYMHSLASTDTTLRHFMHNNHTASMLTELKNKALGLAGQNEILIGRLYNLIQIRSGWPLQKVASSGQLLFSALSKQAHMDRERGYCLSLVPRRLGFHLTELGMRYDVWGTWYSTCTAYMLTTTNGAFDYW